jgi:hypothetical protein
MSSTTLRDTESLVYRFDAATPGAFWLARQLCERWLRDNNVRRDAVCDLLVVLTELCAASGPSALVLRGRVDGDAVVLTVESAGPQAVAVPVDDAVRPAGDLRLAAALCDELVLRVTPEQTAVTARRHGVVLPD